MEGTLLDLIGSWDAPNLSTRQGMGPVHASKASRRGLRLDRGLTLGSETLDRGLYRAFAPLWNKSLRRGARRLRPGLARRGAQAEQGGQPRAARSHIPAQAPQLLATRTA